MTLAVVPSAVYYCIAYNRAQLYYLLRLGPRSRAQFRRRVVRWRCTVESPCQGLSEDTRDYRCTARTWTPPLMQSEPPQQRLRSWLGTRVTQAAIRPLFYKPAVSQSQSQSQSQSLSHFCHCEDLRHSSPRPNSPNSQRPEYTTANPDSLPAWSVLHRRNLHVPRNHLQIHP